MLRKVATFCSDILLKKDAIKENEQAIYIYGFELFFSTFLGVISILICGFIFSYLKYAVVFLAFFLPIRVFAGGYHAKTYGTCFFLTNLSAIFCIRVSIECLKYYYFKLFLPFLLIVSFFYIWKNAPFVSNIHPLSEVYIARNRHFSHILLAAELVLIMLFEILKVDFIVYIGIITSCVVAIMIFIAKREEGSI